MKRDCSWANGYGSVSRIFRPNQAIDELVKSRTSVEFVIPAKAGTQLFQDVLDPGFRRGDAPRDFLRNHQPILLVAFLWEKIE
jgi:hypothetical protein